MGLTGVFRHCQLCRGDARCSQGQAFTRAWPTLHGPLGMGEQCHWVCKDMGLDQGRSWGGGKEPGTPITLGEMVSVVLLVNAPSSQLLLHGGRQALEPLLLGLEMLFSGNKTVPWGSGAGGMAAEDTRWQLIRNDISDNEAAFFLWFWHPGARSIQGHPRGEPQANSFPCTTPVLLG